jgi:hypothetical protein
MFGNYQTFFACRRSRGFRKNEEEKRGESGVLLEILDEMGMVFFGGGVVKNF